MDRKKWLSVAMALALAAPGAFAAETERDAHHPGTAPPAAMPGMPMGVPPGHFASMPADGRVLAVPFDNPYVHINAMYQSIAHRMPVVNGYAATFGDVRGRAHRRARTTCS